MKPVLRDNDKQEILKMCKDNFSINSEEIYNDLMKRFGEDNNER